MENNENYIVENIRSHREEIDLDGLWAEVAPQIPKEKKRRRLGHWIIPGLTLVILLVGFAWVLDVSNQKVDSKLLTVEEIANEQNSQAIGSEKEILEIELTTPKESRLAKNLTLIKNTKSEISNSKPSENVKSTPKNKHIQKALFLESENNEDRQKSTTIFNGKDDFQKNIISSTSTIFKKQESVENDKFQNSSVNQLENNRTSIDIIDLEDQELQALKYRRNLPRFVMAIPIIKIENPKINRWSAYLIGGAAMVNRRLDIRIIELQAERDRRSAVIDVLGSWEVEGGLGFRITSKLKLMTGFNYTQIHERAEFDTDYLINYEIEKQNLIHFQDGTVTNESGSTDEDGIRHTQEIRYNQLSLFQIPLKVSYQFLKIDKVKINIGAFASYSFKQRYAGHTSLSASSESYNLDLDKENKFRKSGAISYGLYLEGSTHLTSMTDLSISLGYRTTNRINREIYLIDQQYNSLSFTSGFHRRF